MQPFTAHKNVHRVFSVFSEKSTAVKNGIHRFFRKMRKTHGGQKCPPSHLLVSQKCATNLCSPLFVQSALTGTPIAARSENFDRQNDEIAIATTTPRPTPSENATGSVNRRLPEGRSVLYTPSLIFRLPARVSGQIAPINIVLWLSRRLQRPCGGFYFSSGSLLAASSGAVWAASGASWEGNSR